MPMDSGNGWLAHLPGLAAEPVVLTGVGLEPTARDYESLRQAISRRLVPTGLVL
jgi:hypothetical protein